MAEQTPRTGGPNLNFSLPSYGAGKRGGGWMSLALLLLSIAAVALLVVALLLMLRPPRQSYTVQGGPAAEPEAMRKLALRLEKRGLAEPAAKQWADYADAAGLDAKERCQKLAHAAGLLQTAGKYEDAIVLYFRADELGPGEEVKGQIDKGLHECFTRLGKYADLFYELKDRTSLGTDKVDEGEKVVAEIGPRKLTLREFERRIDEEIEKMAAGAGAQAGQYRTYMREQYAGTEAKQRKLQEMLGQEVLAREARERKIDQSDAFRNRLADLSDRLLAQEVVQAEIARTKPTDSDYKLYYDANKDKYKDPAKARISRILLADEAAAAELLKELKTPDDFAKAAREKSADAKTKEKGGEVADEVRAGSQNVPGVGSSKELCDAIFASEAGEVLGKPFKTSDGFNLVLVREKTPERQKTFDESKESVQQEYDRQKQQETVQKLIEDLFAKHAVNLHLGVIAGETPGGEEPGQEPKGGGKPAPASKDDPKDKARPAGDEPESAGDDGDT